MVLSIARSRLALLVQFAFLILNALGVLFGIIFNAQTPDLYENNAHHKIGWVATWILTAQVVMGLLFAYSGRGKKATSTPEERVSFLPLNASTMTQVDHAFQDEESPRWSGDSGQGTEPPSPSSEDPNMTPGQRRELYDRLSKSEPEDDPSEDGDFHGKTYLRGTSVGRFLTTRVPKLLSKRLIRIMEVIYLIINRTSLILGFIAIATGGVTYSGIMVSAWTTKWRFALILDEQRGDSVLNGLAHFIKGGIFFWYGLLTLGRWMGCFADFGWAWNIKPSRSEVGQWKARIPSGEFAESFVIFLYGSINVFLEHLAAWGDRWAPEDFEHVSISILFFGGGLVSQIDRQTSYRGSLTQVAVRDARRIDNHSRLIAYKCLCLVSEVKCDWRRCAETSPAKDL